ncbi:S41 family peptidase [uncultured Enterococcus sp.]|uniref:S41 family peptidase n=1 Tax=uncultured Enterococcus sp. TaxID=167972 RepID=UPI0025E645FE|nr:S41 family peptidase [uncultured Enterococcus sp.]
MKQKKPISKKLFVGSLLLTAVVSGGVVFSVDHFTNNTLMPNQVASTDELAKVHALYDVLEANYYKKVDTDKLVDGALKGMTEALDDPYTTYLEKPEATELNQSLSDSFEGIGATLTLIDGIPQIAQAPIKDTPAEKAGLKAGDQILAVDGKETTDKTLTEIVNQVRGEKGTDVTLTLKRGDDTFKVTLTRDKIPLYSVASSIDDKHPEIGKIEITTFAEKTATELKEAIESLRKQGATAFVIDLRQNPGGLLDQVSNMASMFLKDGQTIVQLEDRDGTIQKTVASKELDGGFKVTEPTVVLVDGGSASASEIFAGAVNESANIPLIGTKTFGKGTVQTITEYQDGSEVKLTIKKWLTPNKNWIHEKGITPTIEVDYPAFVYATPLPTDQELSLGVSATAVKSLNTYLSGLGYGDLSGEQFTDATKTAVEQFQQDQGLSVTGVVDAQTVKKIQEAAATLLKEKDAMYERALVELEK